MKILKTISLVIWLLLSVAVASGQGAANGSLRFDREEWSFDRIKEDGGKVSHTFVFTNSGKQAVVIEQVSTSCGCTASEYSKKPIKPGQKGTIKVTFDPLMRPGGFSQQVFVISGAGKNRNALTVTGEVAPRPRTVEEDYPYAMQDGMRFNTLSVNFRYVRHGEPVSMTIGYANTSNNNVSLDFEVAPGNDNIFVTAPQSICGDCRGDITVMYLVPQGDVYGRISNRIYPIINGKREALSFSATSVVTDNFEGIEPSKAPRAKLEPYFYHFGDVKRGEKRTKEFVLINEGKSTLVVRSVELRKGITTTLRRGVSIAPGKSVGFICTLDTSAMGKGVTTTIMTVIVNDPTRPMREVRLAANVK